MDTIMSVVICFLSVYGTFHLLYSLTQCFNKKISTKNRYLHTVIGVDSSADNIEAYVRKTALSEEIKSLVIVRYDTNEEYMQLLNALESEFDFVNILTPDEYADYILSFQK